MNKTLKKILIGLVITTAIAILVFVSLILIQNRHHSVDRNNIKSTKLAMHHIVQYLGYFEEDCGRPPTQQEGLEALTAPSVACFASPFLTSLPKDAWGRDFLYEVEETTGKYQIFSLGKDGLRGGEDENKDIYSTELEK